MCHKYGFCDNAMIPVANPLAEVSHLSGEISNAIDRVVKSGTYILGHEVAALEVDFASYLGVSHAVGVGSGTDGLALALRALDIGPGDEVITVSMTAVATVAAIEMVGARAVLVDVDHEYYTMSPKALEQAINRRTRAVIPVHLYGQAADMSQILRICDNHQIPVVEDGSQAHGASLAGVSVGAMGLIGVFSCYPTKNLGAIGDAGLIVTNDASIAARLRRLRQYGWQYRNWSIEPGINSRLDDLQAAVLRVKLSHLNKMNARRHQIAMIYSSAFARMPAQVPLTRANSRHAWHIYALQLEARDAFCRQLASRGIGTSVHYPYPIHKQPAYKDRRFRRNALNTTEYLCDRVVSLPIFPFMDDTSVEVVVDNVSEILNG